MGQRITTAIGLIALVMVLMYFGGAVMGIAAMICICFAVHEEYHALFLAGHRPVSWPTWVGMAACVPLVLFFGNRVLLPIVAAIFMVTLICVVFRSEPKIEDVLMSVLPLTTVALPGMCIIALAMVEPKELQVVLLSLMFAVPVMADTCAFFVGSRVRGPKLCPQVSPNKTISGAIAGMVGAILTAMVVALVANGVCTPEVIGMLPKWWQYLLIGIIGGVAGQMGDLFASMVKRHCGIKDFSNLFPGHGGMLDRLDSILFMAVVMLCFRLLIV